MAWLTGWAKRRPITVDNTNIDADLTHFPLPVFLGTSVGQNGDDVSSIFDELGSSYLKLAVTDDDGTTQLYVEVEKWDATNEEAVLWVSSSGLTITASSAKTLYIYYDSSQSDNTSYVGGLGGRTEVWDDNFALVAHLAEDPSSTDFIDSTGNGNTGVSDTSSITGLIGQGADLDSGGVNFGQNASLDITSAVTIQLVAKGADIGSWGGLEKGHDAAYTLQVSHGGGPPSGRFWTSDGTYEPQASNSIADGSWHALHATYDGSTAIIYVDGASEESVSGTGTINSGGDLTDKCSNNPCGNWDEIRVSSAARSSAWIKADYYAHFDSILDFQEEEVPFYISGTVKEEGTGVSRTVRVYLRSTGELVGETTSASDGTFSIPAIEDEHYVVALDDTSDSTDYNAQIYDRVTGV